MSDWELGTSAPKRLILPTIFLSQSLVTINDHFKKTMKFRISISHQITCKIEPPLHTAELIHLLLQMIPRIVTEITKINARIFLDTEMGHWTLSSSKGNNRGLIHRWQLTCNCSSNGNGCSIQSNFKLAIFANSAAVWRFARAKLSKSSGVPPAGVMDWGTKFLEMKFGSAMILLSSVFQAFTGSAGVPRGKYNAIQFLKSSS